MLACSDYLAASLIGHIDKSDTGLVPIDEAKAGVWCYDNPPDGVKRLDEVFAIAKLFASMNLISPAYNRLITYCPRENTGYTTLLA